MTRFGSWIVGIMSCRVAPIDQSFCRNSPLLSCAVGLEFRFDSLVHVASARVGLTREWVEAEVVSSTHGFQYSDHLRKMLCRVVGESAVLHVEDIFETEHPGSLST